MSEIKNKFQNQIQARFDSLLKAEAPAWREMIRAGNAHARIADLERRVCEATVSWAVTEKFQTVVPHRNRENLLKAVDALIAARGQS